MPRAWICCAPPAPSKPPCSCWRSTTSRLRCAPRSWSREQFPRLKILARARNRQHAFALKDVGVRYIIRETYGSSLEMAATVLETLGESAASARAAVRKFRQHDEATLEAQYAVKEDETKFLAASREAAQQLEKLFEADEAKTE